MQKAFSELKRRCLSGMAHESLIMAYVLNRWEASGFSTLWVNCITWDAKHFIIDSPDRPPLFNNGLWVCAHSYPLTSIKEVNGDHDSNCEEDLDDFRDRLSESFRSHDWLWNFNAWAQSYYHAHLQGSESFHSRVYDMPLMISFVDYDIYNF